MLRMNVGELVAAFLEKARVQAAFGVISIHNMPILDAIHRRGAIRFVPSRSEAGAVNMADACARVGARLGVAVTSTGTAAGNAAGAMVEALAAGTPLLHLTGQIDSPWLDRDLGTLHEARDQLGMLRAISKAAFRIASPREIHFLREAARTALTPPAGPVSVEIPIDVQQAEAEVREIEPHAIPPVPSDRKSLEELAAKLARARRPLLWLGGGARHAGGAVRKLVELGFGVVTSVQGRGIVPEDHPMTLGAFNISPAVEAFYATCDALLVAGSRLRSNETLGYKLKLPRPLYRIDAEPRRAAHPYLAELFVQGDASLVLDGLAARLSALKTDPAFAQDLKEAKAKAESQVRAGLGPYEALVDELQRLAGREFVWVRDVTISNSTWGNRLLKIFGPRDGVHALGGGIGQGLAMAVGAATASPGRKVVCLAGDGGLALNLGELGTVAQERLNILLLVMNDGGYGVIRNIQDAHYGGRRCYVDLATPDFALLARAYGIRFLKARSSLDFRPILEKAMTHAGPALVEVDMNAVGPFAAAFAGPPERLGEK